MLCRTIFTVAAAAFVLAVPIALHAAESTGAFAVRIERAEEVRQALSAAPDHLRPGAGVYVLTDQGFVRVRESGNGFTCLVVRAGQVLAPTCYDAEGSATLLQSNLRLAELVMAGATQADAARRIAEQFKNGTLKAPQRPGIAYMLSPEFRRHDPATGATSMVFPPHVMFYAPYMKNSDIGATSDQINSPRHVFILNEGGPGAMMIVTPAAPR